MKWGNSLSISMCDLIKSSEFFRRDADAVILTQNRAASRIGEFRNESLQCRQ